MAGAMRKMGVYLGLVEEDERGEHDRYSDDRSDGYADYHEDDALDFDDSPSADIDNARPIRRNLPVPSTIVTSGSVAVRERPSPASAEYRITTLHPRTYNEARTIGEHFRDGVPVIMNLSEMEDSDAKRLVDFAAGLSFGLRGSIERVTNKVFLISPQNVSVTAEDKARLKQNAFFNQS